MDENYLVWGEVETLVSAYKLVGGAGSISNDFESQEVVRRMLKALIKYFSDNNLLVEVGQACVGRAYYRNDFTEEGIELLRRKEAAWLKSKASKKNPPDMRILEKALAEIRAAK
uniref:hypothetical protein n=1 Tax=Pseudomonas laurentiana TaxID=2364649 RepID=UPI0029C66192|nr:hypothetical protein [Pseudomonas laurentiana]